jgi:hypothetical protein
VAGDGNGTEATPASTGTVYTQVDGDGDAGGNDTAAPAPPPFAFEVVRIEECGTTCRDVTAAVTNSRDERATGVQVYTTIYAGNSTDGDDEVWAGTEDVGTLEAGESATSTRRVDLSFGAALKIQNADGWITLVTTVESDEVTITFEDRRNVA